jgi:hypothetical protein
MDEQNLYRFEFVSGTTTVTLQASSYQIAFEHFKNVTGKDAYDDLKVTQTYSIVR